MKEIKMSNQPNQKLRLLHVYKILLEKTDSEHGLTTQEIIEELMVLGLDTQRKTLYRDFEALREFGLGVKQRGGKYWYLETRPLELEEMIMLVDAVQSSPFLTVRLTDKLIKSIRAFASDAQKKLLIRRVEVPSRIKMHNEDVFENLDIIQKAMRTKRKVEFKYFHYDINKNKVLNGDGKPRSYTPITLVYVNEYYYMIGFHEYWAKQPGHSGITPYRVDRMIEVSVSSELATKDPIISSFKIEEHILPSFGIYNADIATVTLEFDESVMNPIIDKFGLDVLTFEQGNERARVHVKVPLSPQFYGWILQLGQNVEIIHPKRAIKEFNELLARVKAMYLD